MFSTVSENRLKKIHCKKYFNVPQSPTNLIINLIIRDASKSNKCVLNYLCTMSQFIYLLIQLVYW